MKIFSSVNAGADGIVFGCLTSEGNLDIKGCNLILEAVKGTKVNFTFHRAFDVLQDPIKAAEEIKNLGFTRILTSGQVRQILPNFDI